MIHVVFFEKRSLFCPFFEYLVGRRQFIDFFNETIFTLILYVFSNAFCCIYINYIIVFFFFHICTVSLTQFSLNSPAHFSQNNLSTKHNIFFMESFRYDLIIQKICCSEMKKLSGLFPVCT